MLWRLVPKKIEMNFFIGFMDSTSTTSTLGIGGVDEERAVGKTGGRQ
jgi:hypothetical protein